MPVRVSYWHLLILRRGCKLRIGKNSELNSDRKLQGKVFDEHGLLFNSGYLFDELEREVNNCETAQDMFIATSDKIGIMFSLTRRRGAYVFSVYLLMYQFCMSVAREVKVPKKFAAFGDYGFLSSVEYSDKNNTISIQGDGNTVAFRFDCSVFLQGRDLHVEGTAKKPFKNVVSAVKPFKNMRDFYAYTHFNAVAYDVSINLFEYDYHIKSMGLCEFARMRTPFRVYRYWAAFTSEDGSYGMNLASGPGKSKVNENAFFMNGEAQKLSEAKILVPFSSDGIDYLKPWNIITEGGEARLQFFPLLDINNRFSIARSRAEHQVFGSFFGSVKLEDGTLFKVEDCFGTIKRYNFVSVGN